MARHLHFPPDLPDLPAAIDEKCRALHTHIPPAIHALFDPYAIGFGDFRLFIRRQIHREIIFRFEFVVGRSAVFRDSNDNGARISKGFRIFCKGQSFSRATRGIVLRLKIQHHRLALDSGKRNPATAIRRQIEIRSAVSGLEFSGGHEIKLAVGKFPY